MNLIKFLVKINLTDAKNDQAKFKSNISEVKKWKQKAQIRRPKKYIA